MAPDTRGRRRLLEWIALDPGHRTLTAIADALGIAQPSVTRWASGSSRPEAHFRTALERLTEGFVVEDDWLTPEEKKLARGVRPMRQVG